MKDYLQCLIWMMLFVIIIEMFFPDSSYRKYIKLILGCILIYTMLTPLMQLVKADGGDYRDYVKKYQEALNLEDDGIEAYKEEYGKQGQSLKEMYEQSMRAMIQNKFALQVEGLTLDWNGDQISHINMVVKNKDKEQKSIELGIEEKSNTINGDIESLKNKIKNYLSDFYNVQVSNIYITVQKN